MRVLRVGWRAVVTAPPPCPSPPPPETVSCPEVSRTHPLPRGGADTLTPKGWGRQDTRNRARGTERACEPEIEEVVEIKI